jgi:protein involved in polysaccharide export with SLBB domain
MHTATTQHVRRATGPPALSLRPLLVLAVLAASTACTTYTPIGAPYITDQPLPPPVATPYVMAPGDLLSVHFYGNAELNEDVPIRPDGAISVPLLGDVQAAGLSPSQLDQELNRRFAGELRDPHVVVIVKEFGAQRVWVGGEVGKPGMILMRGRLSLFAALQEAGGMLPSARRQQIVLIRPGAAGGPAIGRTIDIRPVASGAMPAMDVTLQAQDVIFVPRNRISDLDVFVDQYIRQLLPITPGLGFYVGGPGGAAKSQ